MISKVGDQGSFQQNLEQFQKQGYISLVQFDALRTILEVGHAVIHRAFKVTETELNTALDIMEGILAAIYPHDDETRQLSDRISTRREKRKLPKSL